MQNQAFISGAQRGANAHVTNDRACDAPRQLFGRVVAATAVRIKGSLPRIDDRWRYSSPRR